MPLVLRFLTSFKKRLNKENEKTTDNKYVFVAKQCTINENAVERNRTKLYHLLYYGYCIEHVYFLYLMFIL